VTDAEQIEAVGDIGVLQQISPEVLLADVIVAVIVDVTMVGLDLLGELVIRAPLPGGEGLHGFHGVVGNLIDRADDMVLAWTWVFQPFGDD
jgi:hypothetical protein